LFGISIFMFTFVVLKYGSDMELTIRNSYSGHVVRSFLSLKSMDDKLLDGNVLDKLSAVGFIRTEEVAVA
jgi:hypothetical protein